MQFHDGEEYFLRVLKLVCTVQLHCPWLGITIWNTQDNDLKLSFFFLTTSNILFRTCHIYVSIRISIALSTQQTNKKQKIFSYSLMSKLQTDNNILISKNKLDHINRRPLLIAKAHTKSVATCHKIVKNQ